MLFTKKTFSSSPFIQKLSVCRRGLPVIGHQYRPLHDATRSTNYFRKTRSRLSKHTCFTWLCRFGCSIFTAAIVLSQMVKKKVCVFDNEKFSTVEEWSVPLIRADCHVYVKTMRPKRVIFSPSKPEKLHRQFIYPSADKLYRLLKRACPEEVCPRALKTLEDFTQQCDVFQRIQPAPVRFRV